MTHPQIVKKELAELVEEAKKFAKKLQEGSTIPDCDPFKLTYYVGGIGEIKGAVEVFDKLYPEDAQIRQMWRDTFDAYSLAQKASNTFITECFFRKKMK